MTKLDSRGLDRSITNELVQQLDSICANPEMRELQTRYMELLMQNASLNEILFAAKVMRRFTYFEDAGFYAACAALGGGEYRKAIMQAQSVPARSPFYERALYITALSYTCLDDVEGSRASLSQLEKFSGPKSAPVELVRVQDLMHSKKIEESHALLNTITPDYKWLEVKEELMRDVSQVNGNVGLHTSEMDFDMARVAIVNDPLNWPLLNQCIRNCIKKEKHLGWVVMAVTRYSWAARWFRFRFLRAVRCVEAEERRSPRT